MWVLSCEEFLSEKSWRPGHALPPLSLSLSLSLSPQNACLSQGCKELLPSTQDLQFSVNLRFGTSTYPSETEQSQLSQL